MKKVSSAEDAKKLQQQSIEIDLDEEEQPPAQQLKENKEGPSMQVEKVVKENQNEMKDEGQIERDEQKAKKAA